MTQHTEQINPPVRSRRETAVLKSQIRALEVQVSGLVKTNEQQTQQLKEMSDKIESIYELIAAVTGAIKVLEILARIVKPLSILILAIGGLYTAWTKK